MRRRENDGANSGRSINARTPHPHLGHVTVQPRRAHVGHRPNLGIVNWKSYGQPANPLTAGDWQHGRADMSGRPTNSAPDTRRLAA
ncbi:hypothetical protein BHM03_00035376 [Ensete ventricosum]|nr:hypothetical protein BHM03_00035376 [Ensete ventricosum]